MARRTGRTLAQVDADRVKNQQERQDYFKELQREEQRKNQQAAMEAAEQVISEYRERRPALFIRLHEGGKVHENEAPIGQL